MMNPANLNQYLSQCQRYYLKPGYVFAANQAQVIQTVLGSCVSVCLHDSRRKAGGMNHYLLPDSAGEAPTARFGQPAIQALVQCMLDMGSLRKDLVAQIIGGASIKGSENSLQVGNENVRIARESLHHFGIKLHSEDVGGFLGRKVLFLTELNQVLIYKLETVRRSDFYNYIDTEREHYGRIH